MFLVAMGALFALQGAGMLAWPADSFMLGDRAWLLRGAALAGCGAAVLWWAARRRP